MEQYEFDAATAVRPDGDAWAGEVIDGWDIGGNANGGYALSLAANAMRAASGRLHPVTVTAHYLSPCTPGPVRIETEIVKQGKRMVTVAASMTRDGKPMLRLLGAFGDLAEPIDNPGHIDGEPPELPAIDDCVPRHKHNGKVPVPLNDRIRVALHPDDDGLQEGRPSGKGLVRGWFAFADGRPIDTLSLLLGADAFPPAVFNIPTLPQGWVPTVELTVHVRGVPAPGPLRGVFRTRYATGGALEEDGELWDADGHLVALSRQYGLLARV